MRPSLAGNVNNDQWMSITNERDAALLREDSAPSSPCLATGSGLFQTIF